MVFVLTQDFTGEPIFPPRGKFFCPVGEIFFSHGVTKKMQPLRENFVAPRGNIFFHE